MVRLRIKYEKVGAIRYTSHRDTMRVFRRAISAAELPVCYSQGFNPHPKLSFGPSLRTGWESRGEYMDLLLEHPVPEFASLCNPHLPAGFRVVDAAFLRDGVPKLSTDVCAARYRVVLDEWDNRLQDASAIENELRSPFTGHRDRESAQPMLLDIQVTRDDNCVTIDYLSTMHNSKSVFSEELLEPLLGDCNALPVPPKVTRFEMYVSRDDDYVSPIYKGVMQELS